MGWWGLFAIVENERIRKKKNHFLSFLRNDQVIKIIISSNIFYTFIKKILININNNTIVVWNSEQLI